MSLKHLENLPIPPKIIHCFYREKIRYAVFTDEGIVYDNLGLKGKAATWAKEYLEAGKSEIIKINVGGSVFASYKSTFTKKIKKPNSEDYYTANLIEEILDGRLDYNLDDNGGIFFDRNPFYFEFILEVRK